MEEFEFTEAGSYGEDAETRVRRRHQEMGRELDLALRQLSRALEDCSPGARLREETRDSLLQARSRLERLARRWRQAARESFSEDEFGR